MAKRRGNAEGSVHQRKDGRWAASVSLGYRNGVRHRKHFLGHTRAAVVDQLNEALGKHKRGIEIDPAKQTVAEFLNRWLIDSIRPRVRPKTYHSYEQLIRIHLIPALGRIQRPSYW